jgi:alkyldihydroxyacetonephosphate synthase
MTRSWWGWGDEEAAVAGTELEGLAQVVAARFGGDPPVPVDPPDVRAVALPAPRVALPASLAHLADGPGDPHRDRVRHAHGQAFRDVVRAVHGEVGPPPDVVARPRGADDVAALLDWAADHDVAVVPWGGGSSVVGGVTPPDAPTVTLDLTAMDRVLEVDPTSLAAHVQAGALGPRIEQQLRPHDLTLRHFPQSWEFSTLGGWIATRAGGHYATRWTHVDDLVESVGAQTPAGRWESRRLPASGAGPSPDRLLLGSEGSLGVVTDAWVRVQRRPTFRAQASVSFPTTTAGAAAVRDLAQSGLDPANCRLLDPTEAALAGAGDGSTTVLVLGFESADHPLEPWMDRALELVADHGGTCPDGPVHRRGDATGGSAGAAGAWRRAFLRAPYLRDGLARLGVVVETFETAITWDRFDEFVGRVTEATTAAVVRLCGAGSVSLRLTHAYPDGAAPYLTVIAPAGGRDPVAAWDEVKAASAEAILAAGGTITHHHAVGRDHAPWYARQVPAPFRAALAAAKQAVDPAGVCNPGVLGLGAVAG